MRSPTTTSFGTGTAAGNVSFRPEYKMPSDVPPSAWTYITFAMAPFAVVPIAVTTAPLTETGYPSSSCPLAISRMLAGQFAPPQFALPGHGSHRSPWKSWSTSTCLTFEVVGQLSAPSGCPSPSASGYLGG